MPRPLRFELTGIAQHVLQRGNNRQPAFFADDDYRRYLECLAGAAPRHGCEVHAYVLMSNHVHLLVTPHRPDGLAKLMQSIGRQYVRYVNDRYRRSGTLWEGRYKAGLVGGGDYLLSCCRYIEQNPVRAGLVQGAGDYRWSSYARNALGKADRCIQEHADYRALGPDAETRARAYRELFGAPLAAGMVDDIRRNLHQCRAYAPEQFIDAIELTLRRRIRPGKPGRPRKPVVAPEPALTQTAPAAEGASA